jgi:hypothetical protein
LGIRRTGGTAGVGERAALALSYLRHCRASGIKGVSGNARIGIVERTRRTGRAGQAGRCGRRNGRTRRGYSDKRYGHGCFRYRAADPHAVPQLVRRSTCAVVDASQHMAARPFAVDRAADRTWVNTGSGTAWARIRTVAQPADPIALSPAGAAMPPSAVSSRPPLRNENNARFEPNYGGRIGEGDPRRSPGGYWQCR